MTRPDSPRLSCLDCGSVFPTSSTLASLQVGRRVACDPRHQRAWLICSRCGQWNLLGTDTGRAISTELRERLPGFDAGGIHASPIGDLEVLRVSTDSTEPMASRRGASTVKVLRVGGRFRWLARGFIPAWMTLILFGSDLVASGRVSAESFLFVGCMLVGFSAARLVTQFAMRRVLERLPLIATALGTMALLVVIPPSMAGTWFDRSLTLSLLGIWVVGLSAYDLVASRAILVDGKGNAGQLTPLALRNLSLGRSEGGSSVTAFDLKGGATASDSDALRVVQAVSTDLIGKVSADEVEQGWVLLRMHGGVAGLVDALDILRPDNLGKHRWHELPNAWQVAFHIGAVEALGTDAEQELLRESIREASEVAAIAEALDQG